MSCLVSSDNWGDSTPFDINQLGQHLLRRRPQWVNWEEARSQEWLEGWKWWKKHGSPLAYTKMNQKCINLCYTKIMGSSRAVDGWVLADRQSHCHLQNSCRKEKHGKKIQCSASHPWLAAHLLLRTRSFWFFVIGSFGMERLDAIHLSPAESQATWGYQIGSLRSWLKFHYELRFQLFHFLTVFSLCSLLALVV